MANDSLHSLLRHAQGKAFRFVFADGEEMLAEVISSSHIDEDDTVIIVRVDASAAESGWLVQLSDIRSVRDAYGHSLYKRE
jgi:hypothetical protein